MRLAILLVTVLLLWVCLPGAGLCEPGSTSFEKRFDLPRDPDALLMEILARRDFGENPVRDAFERLIDRVKEVLAEVLRRIWRSVPNVGPVDAAYDPIWIFLSTILAASGVTVLALLGKRLFEFILKQYGASRGARDPEREIVLEEGSDEILDLALKAAEQGEYAAAVVLLFRHALVRLDETGRLSLHPGRTNREILASIPADQPIRRGLSVMIPIFNRVRYGRASCGKSEYERFLAVCTRVTGGDRAHAA